MRPLFLACRWLTSHCVFIWLFLCAGEKEISGLSSSSIRPQTYRIRFLPLWIHIILITSVKAPSPNTVTLRIRIPTYEFLEDTIHSITGSSHYNRDGNIVMDKKKPGPWLRGAYDILGRTDADLVHILPHTTLQKAYCLPQSPSCHPHPPQIFLWVRHDWATELNWTELIQDKLQTTSLIPLSLNL